ncbi:MAG: hypothetical protein J6V44_11155 [Methanobrevibacter sp.]|nr:hypothetical protein [Methanobrevibacter sp.]
MTYTLYLALLVTLFLGAIISFISAIFSVAWDEERNACVYGLLGIGLAVIGFMIVFLSPDRPTIIENTYNKILQSRPECVKNVVNNDFTTVSLECAEKYINYRTDSLRAAKDYFEIKEQILKKLK